MGHNEQKLFVFLLFVALVRKLKMVIVVLHVTSWPFPLGCIFSILWVFLLVASSASGCVQHLLKLWVLLFHSDGSGCSG